MTRATLLLLLLTGCAETIGQPTGPASAGGVDSTAGPEGLTTTTIDASDPEAWVYFSFAAGQVQVDDPASSTAWDLAFRRVAVRVNGGTSGPGQVIVAIAGEPLEDLATAPEADWFTDAGDDALAFDREGAWYAYDVTTHIVSPRERTWVVRAAGPGFDGSTFYKLAFRDYYDAAGSGGFPVIEWGPVAAPDALQEPSGDGPEDPLAGLGEDAVIADGSDAWAYLTAAGQPATADGAWDLAFKGSLVRTNGGASGSGLGGARLVESAWDEVVSADTVGYDVDAVLPVPRGGEPTAQSPAFADWYDYDQTTHALTPRPGVYLLRTAAGEYAKLELLAWDDGRFGLRLAALPRQPAVHTLDADASAPIRVSLRHGTVVTPEAPHTSLAWDLVLDGVLLGTNSGTSGPGQGGAADPGAGSLDAVDAVSDMTFEVDNMLAVPGPPGSGEASGSPVLGGWYDYDPSTHQVSPGPRVYVVRTADGGYAALQVLAYQHDVYTLAFTYAGPGRSTF